MMKITSFGFKSGEQKPPTRHLLDVRHLTNPHHVPGLRELTGQDLRVQQFVLSDPKTSSLLTVGAGMLALHGEAAIGCFGGRHRSVAIAELLAAQAHAAGFAVTVEHMALGVKYTLTV